MYSRGKGRLTSVSLLALVLLGSLFAGTADAKPGISSMSIMDATYNGTTLHIVFDRPVTFGSLALTDFVFSDSTDATGAALGATGYANVVTISGAWTDAPAPDTTMIALNDTLMAVAGTNWGGTPQVANSRDYSYVQVHSGPVIVGAFPSGIAGVAGHADDEVGNDTLAVQFSHPLAFAADSLFYMEELSLDTEKKWSVVAPNIGGANPDTVYIAWYDTTTHKMIQPGYSKIRLNLNTTPGTDTTATTTGGVQATSNHYVRVIDQDGITGPKPIYGLYNENTASTSDDEFFLVTNQDLVFPAGGSNTFPTIAALTGWSVAGGENFVIDQRDSLNAHQTRNYLRSSLNTGPVVPGAGDLVAFAGAGVVESATDSIGNILTGTVPVASGPGILQAWGVEAATDSLIVRVSEGLAVAATASDFRVDSVAANTAGWSVVSGGNGPVIRMAGGDFVHGTRIAVDSAAGWSGATSTNANPAVLAGRWDGTGYVPVFDATDPNASVAEDTIFERNPGGGASHAYIQFVETTDNADYYLLYTRVDGPITQTYFRTNINVIGAIPIPNPGPGLDTVKVIADITPGLNDVSGTAIEQGRQVYFGVAPVDCDGNIGAGTGFPSHLVAGPVACPRDVIMPSDALQISLTATDTVVSDDNIWIVGHKYPEPDTLIGDSLAVDPYDVVVVYRDVGLTDSVTSMSSDSLGRFTVPLPGNGVRDEGDANGFIYLTSRDQFNNYCGSSTAILNDRTNPGIPIAVWDPQNPARVYGPGDSVSIFMDVVDTTTVATVLADDNSSIMTANVTITTYHTPPETLATANFVSWGADQTDNDLDWYDGDAGDTNTTCGDVGAGNLDPLIVDPYTTSCFPYHAPGDSCAIGQHDYAEPYIDENSNGAYDKGEPYTDLNGNKVHDAGGDTSLDYLDTAPIQSLACEGGTPGPWVRRENHIFHATIANLDEALNISNEPVQWIRTVITISDNNENMTVVQDSFMITFDNLAPEQSQFTRLARRNGLIDSTGSGNLVPPGYPEDNCYDIADYVDFDVTAFSDSNDVDYVVLQINTGASWVDMALDPAGDKNADGLPGKAGIDDDGDGWADTLDPQVRNAMTTTLAGDAADTSSVTGGDGIYALNDGIDNDHNGMVDDALDTLYGHNNMWAQDDDEDGMANGTTVPTVTYALANGDSVIGRHIDGTAGRGVDYWPYLMHVAGKVVNDTGATIAGDERDSLFPLLQTVIPPGPGGSPLVYSFADLMGFNLNMRLIQNEYSIGNEAEFFVRGVPYDTRGGFIGPKYSPPLAETEANRTGNHDAAVANNICMRVDTTGVECMINVSKFYENLGADSAAAGGLAETDAIIWDSDDSSYTDPAEPLTYVIEGSCPGAEKDSIVFYYQQWNDSLGTWLGTWTRIGADSDGEPWNVEWTPASVMDNHPCDKTTRFYFYCQAFGSSGAFEAALADTDTVAAELKITMVDHVFPVTNITSVGQDSFLVNGAIVPADSAVHITVGGADLNDRDGDATTNDIISIEFQQRRTNAGGGQPGQWYTIGSTATPFDSIPPVDVKWRTDTLSAHNYDLRAVGIDCEGNSNINFTQVVSVTIDTLGLRAYIEPEEVLTDSTIQLYAQVFIHDVEVDNVQFQTWPDSNGNCLADENVSWLTVATDDNDDSSSTDPGGDVTLRVGEGDMPWLYSLSGPQTHRVFPDSIGYIDYDGDGYSPLDPIVYDAGANGWYAVAGNDSEIVGSVVGSADSFMVTNFLATEFYVDSGNDGFTAEDWIFGDNLGGITAYGTDSLELYTATWFTGDLTGSWLVRALATDELGNVDTDSNTAIPFICVGIDNDYPEACISSVALGDGGYTWGDGSTCLDASDSSVCGNNSFLYLCATLNDTLEYSDLAWVKFQWSVDNINWNDLDINDDDDMFADVDDTLGFSGDDPIVRDDYSADMTFTVDATDVLLRNGLANTLSDLYGQRLYPLISEDVAGGGDDDGDGTADEDTVEARDFRAPYCAYIDIDALTSDTLFRTSTLLYVRAVAEDDNGNTDPSPTVTAFTIMENVSPETDVVWAITEDGDTVDVYPQTQDSDGGDQFDDLTDTLKLHVTVQDTSATDSVRIWYRWNPNYNCELTNLTNPWVEAAGVVDQVYPYNLDWPITDLQDGCYQFQVIADNDKCNMSHLRLNPYEFKLLTTGAEIIAASRPLNLNKFALDDHYTSTVLDTVTKGSELWIRAELASTGTPLPESDAAVTFKYSDRVLGELLDVQTFYPYISDSVMVTTYGSPGTYHMYGSEATWDCDVEVLVNDSVATYYTAADFDLLADPTKYDYKIIGGGRRIQFGAQLASTDSAWVSYNYGGWTTIQDSPDDDVDENGYFTTAWDPTNPVPDPKSSYTDAYDLIALVSYEDACQTVCVSETECSEGKIVILEEINAPEVTLHGFFWDEESPFTRYNDPGNPLRQTNGDHQKTKLCGIEYDAFVYVDSVEATAVNLAFDSGTEYPLTHYVAGDTLWLTISMQENDYLLDSVAIFSDSIENVQLYWNNDTYYTMYDDGTTGADLVAGDGWWSAHVPIIVSSAPVTYPYQFDIDMSGDEKIVSNDRRNNASNVVVRSDFWHRNFTTEIDEGVHYAVATATGINGTEGSNLTSDQGPVVFIIDCTAPYVEAMYVDPTIVSHDSDCDTFTITVVVRDGVGGEIQDILAMDEVSFQFATDDSKTRWVELGGEIYSGDTDGWVFIGEWPTAYDPHNDNIDNDNDGETDEDDEKDYSFSLRVVIKDDGWNTVIYEDGTMRVDLDPPLVVMTSPDQGTVVAFGDSFTVCAMPASANDAVGLDYYKFYFAESSGVWKTIDPTPIDNTDNEWVPADGMNEVCVTFATDWLDLQEDQYVQFLAVGVDSACNETPTDEVTPIVVAVNDTVGPAACILTLTNYCGDDVSVADPHLAISGDSVYVNGTILDSPNNISIVELWVQPVGGTAQLLATTNQFTGGSDVSLRWNANEFAAPGTTEDVDVWFLARDLDGNPDPTPLKTRVRVDRENPTVAYDAYADTPFIEGVAPYDDDGIEDHSSMVIVPDPTTGWVTFRVYTPDDDIASMVVQFRPDSSANLYLGNWRNLAYFEGDDITMDFEPQHTRDGMYFWWARIEGGDWIGDLNIDEAAHVYQWRIKATDYACNTNILDPDFTVAAIDTVAPNCLFFGDAAVADGEIGQVAAGDDVLLRWYGCDNDVCGNDAYTFRTDVERVIYWYVAPVSGDTVIIGTDDAPVADGLDLPATKWTSEITWTTPEPLVRDRDITVGAWAYDTPGNRSECLNTIRVEDKDPPVRTRLVDVTGSACNIYPREVTETVLNNQTITWSDMINLYAETAVGDSGIATVWFMAIDPDGDTLVIGADESPSATVDGPQTVWRWSVGWNANLLDEVSGEPMWKEGTYTVWVFAVDEEENYEVPTLTYTFTLDNTAPTAQAAVNGETGNDISVNRGDMVYVSAESTGEPDDDIVVTWWMRTHNDSTPGADSWLVMDSTNGFYPVDDKDVNPDSTRPYSWEWATWRQDPSLEVGNCYDVVATSSDLVCNEDSVWSAWNAGRGVTFCVIDTTAPCATITHLERDLCRTHDPIEQPNMERIRGFASLTATILGGETDVEKVAFEYSTDGETWTLADQDLVEYGDFGWRLTTWDSDQVPEGPIWFRAVAYDDVGNVNEECAGIVQLIVDRTPPALATVAPTEQMCPFVVAADGEHVVPLIVTSSADQWHDQAGLSFEWKKSVEDTTHWDNTDVDEWLYDEGTGYYTATWSVEDAEAPSGKYDFRVTATDSACNTTVMVMATEVVIDIDDPVVDITNLEIDRWRGSDSTTVVIPINNDVIVDVSSGEPVRIFATATDDEQDIPGTLETAVDSVFFEVAADTSGTIYHIDLGDPVGDEGLYVAHWNTTALEAGTYWVRARATDECGNDGVSPWIAVNVIDNAQPRAAIICWEPDIINDINGTTKVRVYATKWCTQQVDEVMFQYRKVVADTADGGDGFAGKAAADAWVTFGLQTQPAGNPDNDSPDSLWYSELEIGPETTWMVGDMLELRAVAITLVDGDPGNDRDVLYFDQNPPYTVATVVADRFNRDLEPVHPDAEPWIAYDKVELVAPTESDFYVELSVSDYVVDSLDWGSIAKPWVLVTADRLIDEENFEEIVEMDPMNNGAQLDDYAWSGFTWNSLLDSIGCGGYVYVNAAVVEDSGEADDGGPARIDIIRHVVAVHEVTNGAGSRGTVAIPGDDDNLTVSVPSGNGVYGGLLMTTTHTPNFPQVEDQRFWIRPVGQAYKIRMLDCTQNGCSSFNDGYWATVTLSYDDEDLTVRDYLGHDVTVNESELLVGWWNDGHWDASGISELTIDTTANTVTFLSEDFCYYDVWSIVGITSGNNVEFYPWCNGYTNNSPEIHLTIADFLETSDYDVGIDEPDVELWIDNHLWAGGPGDVDGNGYLTNVAENDDSNVITYAYGHSTYPSDLLTGGKHTLRFRYRNVDEDYWFTIEREFMVDVVPPTIEWAGGFIDGPCVGTSDCFLGGSSDHIALQIHDYEAGVFTQESSIDAVLNIIFGDFFQSLSGVTIDVNSTNSNTGGDGGDVNGTGNGGSGGGASGDITNNITVTTSSDTVSIPLQDMGLKMDVWLVDTEDDQTDIDEYMERTLIQAATPAMLLYSPELCQWSDPSECDPDSVYDPSDDLWVSLPLTVNFKPYDGREVEVVLYSTKVEHIGLDINTGDAGTGDDDNEEFTKYIFGPFDCVGNVGSQYVARRFIIDTSAPSITFNTPVENSIVAPGSEIPIDAVIADGDEQTSGSGIDASSIRISLSGPGGVIWDELMPSEIPVVEEESGKQNENDPAVTAEPVVDADGISMTVVGIDEVGLYTLTIEGADNSGNGFNVAHSWTVGASVLQITDAQVWPNPANPDEGEQANISFFLGGQRPSNVEISIYDFAGDLVWTNTLTGQQGQVMVQWAGTTSDGTAVASGGYIARIVANDGAATKTATVKIAIRKFGGTN